MMKGRPTGQELLEPLLARLAHKLSGKRRAAAKQLRKLKNPAAGPALMEALRSEIRDRRTWETQYHIVMAIAECGVREALPILKEIALVEDVEHMVLVAIGDALVRLGRAFEQDPTPVFEVLSLRHPALVEGAIRAVATLHLRLSPDAIRAIIRYSSRPENESARFWTAAAAAGWEGADVEAFLRECANAELESTRKAAAASLDKKYLQWNPL